MLLRSYDVAAMAPTAAVVAAMKQYSSSIDYFAYIFPVQSFQMMQMDQNAYFWNKKKSHYHARQGNVLRVCSRNTYIVYIVLYTYCNGI